MNDAQALNSAEKLANSASVSVAVKLTAVSLLGYLRIASAAWVMAKQSQYAEEIVLLAGALKRAEVDYPIDSTNAPDRVRELLLNSEAGD